MWLEEHCNGLERRNEAGFTFVNRPLKWLQIGHAQSKILNPFKGGTELNNVIRLFFSFRRYNFSSLNVLAFKTYNFQFLRSWMQLVQFCIFSFLCHSFCHLPICSLVSLVVFLTSVSTCILFYHSFFWNSI
jgi:hypothetical protein